MSKNNQNTVSGETPACTQRDVEITEQDLPLSCPPWADRIWDAHPRVYLPIEETGEEVCPYCATHYKLMK